MIRRFTKLNQTGDTIVEVLIVLAILGLALSIGYATANRGLQQSRNAQEHSQALGIINSQVELLRSAFAKQKGTAIESQGGASGGPFCLTTSGPDVVVQALANSGPDKFNDTDLSSDKLGNTTTYPGPCIDNTFYNVSIYPRGNGVYDFRVRWEGLGNLGRQQEEITYKLGNVAAANTGSYTNPRVPPPPVAPTLSISLIPTPTTVSLGSSVRLDWSVTPLTASCTASGGWTGNKSSSGTTTISVPLSTVATTLTYTLSCTLAGSSPASQTVTVNVAPYTPTLATLYRLYTYNSLDHFYTASQEERDRAITVHLYTDEGNIGKVDTVQGPGEIPIYRFWVEYASEHFYTVDKAEADRVEDAGWTYEGITGYIKEYNGVGECPDGTSKMYRMFSDYLLDHFYTNDVSELNDGRDHYWPESLKPRRESYNPPRYNPGSGSGSGPYQASPAFGPKWYNRSEGIMGCIYN